MPSPPKQQELHDLSPSDQVLPPNRGVTLTNGSGIGLHENLLPPCSPRSPRRNGSGRVRNQETTTCVDIHEQLRAPGFAPRQGKPTATPEAPKPPLLHVLHPATPLLRRRRSTARGGGPKETFLHVPSRTRGGTPLLRCVWSPRLGSLRPLLCIQSQSQNHHCDQHNRTGIITIIHYKNK